MNRSLVALTFASSSLLVGCVGTWQGDYFLSADDQVLAVRDLPGGNRETYRFDSFGDGSLVAVREFDREQVSLGLQVTELDKAAAERRGVKPYAGLLVQGVAAKSSADEGGVLAGDVLLSLADKETVYLPQVAAIEASLRAGQIVHAKLMRGQQQVELSLAAKLRKERVREEQRTALEVPAQHNRPYAGLTLRGIPATWCERMFGTRREAVVVINAEVGAPAWLAGVRPGDVIDTVDGAPVPDVHELMRRIAAQGENEQAMTLGVRRGSGPAHEGTVELADYSDDAGLWVPLVFHVRNGTYEDRWSIGPWGLVMSNRNRYVADPTTRRVQTRNVFSAVLGLFRVETTPAETEVRLLWFIRFDT